VASATTSIVATTTQKYAVVSKTPSRKFMPDACDQRPAMRTEAREIFDPLVRCPVLAR
jgi:hypothetical protein